ncbi:HD-GYP domain-containing protein [Brevibacillus humidisoli]|uniref:HD-GYP domain-containing protein n=1 Tax=Brevibacillus humidisoli TaxID=2895522 RepID=UPI001E45DCB0|nr:HD-GYP domain-containing protein [Brevibacillus humidisoli]UFJ40030.1 HD-GYP domain-containing protein [Brevibacillus humidisoli]
MPQMVKTGPALIGKILSDDVYNENGLLLLSRGTELTSKDIRLLLAHQVTHIPASTLFEWIPFGPGDEYSGEIHAQIKRLLYRDPEVIQTYSRALEQTKELFGKISEIHIPSLHQFTEAFFPLLNQVLQETGIFHPIYLLEGSENYTYRHSINVGILSALLAKLLNWPQERIILMGQAGLLHDIGKMMIPQNVLMKPGELTEEEFEVVKKHTIYGYQLLKQMEGTDSVLVQCAHWHHERCDGSGYPEGRTGDELPVECQLVAVADTFDAICSDRVYKSRTSPFEAAKILWGAMFNGKLHPEIVSRFIQYIVQCYVGHKAILSNGEEVEVVLIHLDEPMRPLVRSGRQYIDLRKERGITIEQIVG